MEGRFPSGKNDLVWEIVQHIAQQVGAAPALYLQYDWYGRSIKNQYDEMVKFATALLLGTADAKAILRRFTRNNRSHLTYQALSEPGRVVKTLFLCEYLRLEELRREIHEGLNVRKNWNSANSFIFYGKRASWQVISLICRKLQY